MNNTLSSYDIRLQIRKGLWDKPTAGLSPKSVQVNLVILPAKDAADFHVFCQKNPKPCPVLAISEPGKTFFPELGYDLDIRKDVPKYWVFENGEPISQPNHIDQYWREDLVTFALGCSFTFEHSLIENGIKIRHIDMGLNVPMYKTNIDTFPVGKFSGSTIVSMRPMKAADAIRAIQITSRFPGVHGAPIHIGDPSLIGIKDINTPVYGGGVVPVEDGEMPVFWACGATPLEVLRNAKLPFCITHAPGYMLITDLSNTEYSII